MVEVTYAPNCEQPAAPRVAESAGRVDIVLPFTFDPQRQSCGVVGKTQTIVVELGQPLGDRLLTGCRPQAEDTTSCRDSPAQVPS